MSNSTDLTFDHSLAAFANLLVQEAGATIFKRGIFLRDTIGRLSFVVQNGEPLENAEQLGQKAKDVLGKYVDDAEFVVVTPEQLYDESLRTSDHAIEMRVELDGADFVVNLVDRRAVGADWLAIPSKRSETHARFVFASLKGGVGRSTALCVVASHFASLGKRVLTIDMDLEAPGLGNMLLTYDTLPSFGLLDYLVERGLGEVSDEFTLDMLGPSWLAAGRGRIDVLPALGRASIDNPENVLAKLARAYISSSTAENEFNSSFAGLMEELIDRLTDDGRYDIVLIDARAGLHETTASALLGLRGDIYLFGANQPQTLAGFRLLFASLGLRTKGISEYWSRFRIVQSRANFSVPDSEFESSVRSILSDWVFPVSEEAPDLAAMRTRFDVDWDETSENDLSEDAIISSEDLISILAVRDEPTYRHFDPLKDPVLLDVEKYSDAFCGLIRDANAVVFGE